MENQVSSFINTEQSHLPLLDRTDLMLSIYIVTFNPAQKPVPYIAISNTGTKLFISPRMSKIWSGILPKSENRKLDFYFHYPFEKSDTTILHLPADIKPDALPKESELKCEYASYKSKYWYNDTQNSIYSVTILILKQHKIPAAGYASVKKFFDDVIQDDTQKIVVEKAVTEMKAF